LQTIYCCRLPRLQATEYSHTKKRNRNGPSRDLGALRLRRTIGKGFIHTIMQKVATFDSSWLHEITEAQMATANLLKEKPEEQERLGYFHTLREICSQPASWLVTGDQLAGANTLLTKCVADVSSIILTGSGSSLYAGECARLGLQKELSVTVTAAGGDSLLLHGLAAFPASRPCLVVSLARSGDSPESCGAVSFLKESDPALRHLVLTCNPRGRLATLYRDDPSVQVIALDERTNDRSLVMTNSFTNLVLAARSLGKVYDVDSFRVLYQTLSRIAQKLITTHFGTLADVANRNFNRSLFLGSGARYGAARESSLKMLELTSGRVPAICETYLGLRHGPLSYVDQDTLVVCFLSSNPTLRAYELDLIQELESKKLGLLKLIVGDHMPAQLAKPDNVLIDCPELAEVGDDNAPMIDVVCGQLLAFFRCLKEGLRPDSPSQNGAINRVVQPFQIHR